MRKLVPLAIVLSLSLVACGNTTPQTTTEPEPASQEAESTPEPAQPVATAPSSSLFASAEWPDNEVTSGIPRPDFSVPADSVDEQNSENSPTVTGHWTNVPDDEIVTYVQAIKDAGFIVNARENSSDHSYTYRADDSESVSSNFDGHMISITMNQTQAIGKNGEAVEGDILLTISLTLCKPLS